MMYKWDVDKAMEQIERSVTSLNAAPSMLLIYWRTPASGQASTHSLFSWVLAARRHRQKSANYCTRNYRRISAVPAGA